MTPLVQRQKLVALIEQARWREHLTGQPLILHADNGAAQRSLTLRAKLQSLGIEPSYSRPGVSDDNAFIESWFRTLKYVPGYPSRGFADIEQARQWCHRFVSWYNDEHRHREIGYVTPNQRHNGQSAQVLARRRQVYEGGTPKASGALEPGRAALEGACRGLAQQAREGQVGCQAP